MGWTTVVYASGLCILLFCVLPQGTAAEFDCTRDGSSCGEHGDCDRDTAECVCDDYYEGIFCQNNLNETEEVDPTECAPQCQHEAVCLRTGGDSGDTLCQCHRDYFGEACESKRVSHSCSHDAITISILPDVGQGAFEGLVYVDGQEADNACVLQSSGEGLPLTQTIQLDVCGGAKLVNADDGTDYYSFTVVVQYSELVREITDERYSFTCEFRPAGSSIEGQTDISSPGGEEEDKYNPPDEVKEVLQPFEVSIVQEDGSPLEDATVQLGKILQLRVLLNGGKVYDSFRLEEVTANNDLTGDKFLKLFLVQDSCPELAPDGHVIEFYNNTAENEAGEEVPAAFLKFRTFRFLHSINVNFHLIIKVCQEEENCLPLECDGDTYAGIGRRKRDTSSHSQSKADASGATLREYDTRITVYGGEDNQANRMYPAPPGGRGQQSEDKFCMTRIGLILFSLLLNLLLTLAITTTVCACARLLRRKERARGGGIDNEAFSEKL